MTPGSRLLAELQAEGTEDLDRRVLALVRRGELGGPWSLLRSGAMPWVPLPTQRAGHSAIFSVAPLPVCVGDADDYFFAPVSADTQQQLADHLGLVQPTTRLFDLCRTQAAYRVEPATQPADAATRSRRGYSPSMKDAFASARFTTDTLARLAGRAGLAGFPYKGWMLTTQLREPGDARNYGFFTAVAPTADGPFRSASGLTLWQPLGGRHNTRHWDYSQVAVFFRDECVVDGKPARLTDVLLDPELCVLASEEGVLPTLRQSLVHSSSVVTPRPAQPSTRPLVYRRLLQLGSRDEGSQDDVARVQAFLGARTDGKFGPVTDGLTRQFQRSVGISVDGRWGPQTYARANLTLLERERSNASLGPAIVTPAPAAPPLTPWTPGSPPALLPPADLRLPEPLVAGFRQARHFHRVVRTVELIVLHTAEIAEIATGAEALAAAVATQARVASWHYSVDCDSIWQSVLDEHVAFHAPGVNHNGIGIEISGAARQTEAEWFDPYSRAALELTAQLVARLCRKHALPVEYHDERALVTGKVRGITTHAAASAAFKRSTHTDPGKGFPMAAFLGRVRQLMAAA